jgi:Fe-S-cluster containining protein
MDDHMTKVRQREVDPQARMDAQRRADEAGDKLGVAGREHARREAHRAVQEPMPIRKFVHLRNMTKPLEHAMDGVAACRRGCSHCCHIPVLITQTEAHVMADELKITVAKPEKFVRAGNKAYDGVACPFLADNECSIYESRPLACRIHYSMAGDDLLCQIVPGESIEVPFFNNMPYLLAMVQALPGQEHRLADIRDFFPIGKS